MQICTGKIRELGEAGAIRPDLIPATSWGSSLSNLLTQTSWGEIRACVYGASGGRCQVCSEHGGSSLDAHEVWAYTMPPLDAGEDVVGVQRLITIAALCRPCHSMFHWGMARLQGNEDEVLDRLAWFNGWNDEDIRQYVNLAESWFELRSEKNWTLDLSMVAGFRLVLRPVWNRSPEGVLHRKIERTVNGRDASFVAFSFIVGASYWHRGMLHKTPAIDEAYEGMEPEEGDFQFARDITGWNLQPRRNGYPLPEKPPVPVIALPPEPPRSGLFRRLASALHLA